MRVRDWRDVYGGAYTATFTTVFNSSGVFCFQFKAMDQTLRDEVVSALNENRSCYKISGADLFTYKDSYIYLNNEEAISIRGWGHLIGTLNLREERAAEIQDAFGEHILRTIKGGIFSLTDVVKFKSTEPLEGRGIVIIGGDRAGRQARERLESLAIEIDTLLLEESYLDNSSLHDYIYLNHIHSLLDEPEQPLESEELNYYRHKFKRELEQIKNKTSRLSSRHRRLVQELFNDNTMLFRSDLCKIKI